MKKYIQRLYQSKLAKNSFWLIILQVFNTVVPMLTIPYITRILGVSEYGVFSVALNWILYFNVLVEFGFGLSGARKVAIMEDEKDLQKLFNNIITARIYLLFISFLCMNIISLFSHITLGRYICMLILFCMIIGTTFQLTWLFQGKQKMKFITIVNVIARTVSVLFTFLLVKKGADIYLYCFLYSITYCISSIISMWIAKKEYHLRFHFSKMKEVKQEFHDGKHLFYSSAMSKVFSGIGLTVLGMVAADYDAGIYSAIYKIPYILTMFFSPFSQALYPHISVKYKESLEKGLSYTKKICIYIVGLFLGISCFIMIFRHIFVQILFGNAYAKYADIVIPLTLQFIFGMVNNFIGIQFLVASGHEKKYSRAFIIGCIFMVLLNVILGIFYTLYGVSWAAFLGEFALTLALLYSSIQIIKKEKRGKI